MLRTGILLPRSNLFPSLGLDLLNGIKEYLKQEQVFDSVKLFTDNIGFGIEEQEIYTKAEKMLLQDDVDVVILCADYRISEMLQPLFAASNKILLVVNFGANFPESWQTAATTIQHSLNFCMHASLTGKLAATENETKEAINVLSYYDAGYRQCYSMLTGHQLQGGIPAFNHITNINLKDFTLEPVAEFTEQHQQVKTLLCLFAGDHAEKFYRDISPLQKKLDWRLYVSPMMFEPSLVKTLGDSFTITNVTGYIPWHISLDNETNKQFQKIFSGAAGKQANYFSVLGWETGMILHEVIKRHDAGNNDATAVVQSLENASFNSPRGTMKIDAATRHSYGPAYLARCTNNMEISIESKLEGDEEWKTFSNQDPMKGESSGWRNTYLCI